MVSESATIRGLQEAFMDAKKIEMRKKKRATNSRSHSIKESVLGVICVAVIILLLLAAVQLII